MGYHVEIEASAASALIRIAKGDKASARRIDQAIVALADSPRPATATKLVGANAWRVRVGDYRVVYVIADSVRVVTVTKIRPPQRRLRTMTTRTQRGSRTTS